MDLSNSPEGHHSAAELDLYDEGFKILFPERHGIEGRAICKMRADAVKVAPKDESLALACFRACLKRDSLEYAQQVSPHSFNAFWGCHFIPLKPLLQKLSEFSRISRRYH